MTYNPLRGISGEASEYKVLAAASTTVAVCPQGGYLERLVIVPASSGAGTVTLFDGTTAVFVTPTYVGGNETKPYVLQLGIRSRSTGGFNISSGSSVTAIAVGRFGVE
jgi:hypothetical protein